MRALVTGAAGFIGAHVALTLAEDGWEVRGFDRACVDCVGDIRSADDVQRAMEGCDAVFHLAALYSFLRRDAAAMRAVNVDGARVVLDAAARTPSVKRIVYTSSCATCGPVPGRPATEADTPPGWELVVPYKRTKLDGERLALAAARDGVDVVIVNPTTPVGPGDRRPTPTGKMIADVAAGRARGFLAGGALNIVAVEDVARGHVRAFERGRRGERYLLGGENLPMRDVFAHVAAAVGRPAPWLAVPWRAAFGAAWLADAALRPFGREPELLVLDEVRLGRMAMTFDHSKARGELGHESRPAVEALRAAALAAR